MFAISHEFDRAVREIESASRETDNYKLKSALIEICIALKEIEIKFAEAKTAK